MIRAFCYADKNQKDLAVSEYKQLLQYDAYNSLAWSNMGVQLTELGKIKAAAAVALAYTKLGDTVNATKFHKIRDSLK